MKTDKDWEARARELLDNARQGHNMERRIVGPEAARSVEAAVISAALQLGREMQADVLEHAKAAIDCESAAVRADERENVARQINDVLIMCTFSNDAHGEGWRGGLEDAVRIARGQQRKPKTREQVLEEALREAQARASEIVAGYGEDQARAREVIAAARRALEWTP